MKPNKSLESIYGLGGVGKTTLAKEVVARVKNNLLFADVAFTTVSQTVKVNEIKKDIGEATKRIMKGDKILIILDDVWEKLDLEELCIPCGSNYKNCKILLTSRSEKVCQKMNAQSKIHVNSLPIEEAWILFKRVVGEQVETDADLKPVAEEVAKECGGLPLFIQAVGNALKDESIHSWKTALSRLKKTAASEMDPDIEKAFTRLKLSYDYLKSEEARSCFLLCCLFPEDFLISLEKLVLYGMGLGKFDDLDSIEDARGRVQNAVNILTSSCLLLKVEDNKGYIKMHDVVRDVALLIASQGNNKFLVKARQGLTEWLPRDSSLENYSVMYNDIIKLPDYKVNIPHIEIFLVNGNNNLTTISDEFIWCMKKVKVLDISWNNISSLPQSIQLLTKLRTLDLGGNKSLHEISILGELTDLEILIINETGIKEIPQEIGRLVNLRVLQVKDCKDLSRITHGVISALSKLEDLCIEFKLNFERAFDCIVEVMGLSKLAYLELTVPSIDDIPAQAQGFNSEKLKEFVIQIGEYDPFRSVNISRSDRYLILSRVHLRIPLVKWLKKLIGGSRPFIILEAIENLNNIMPTLYNEGFNKLEHIELENCRNVSCLVDDGDEVETKEEFFKELKHLELWGLGKMEVIWKCPDEYISLTNLVTLKLYNCYKLVRLFRVSVAQRLVNLKDLSICGCVGLEEVIWDGRGEEEMERDRGGGVGESEEIVVEQQQHSSSSSASNTNTNNITIEFLFLTNIYLYRLSSLKSFFSAKPGNGHCSIKYPSLVNVSIKYCESMKKWGPGIHETPNLKTLVGNYDDVPTVVDGPFAINEAVEKSYETWQKGKWVKA